MEKLAFICSSNDELKFSFSNIKTFKIKNKEDYNKAKKSDCEYFMLCSSYISFDKYINFNEIISFIENNNIDIFSFMPYNSDLKKILKINKSGFYDIKDGFFNLNYDTYIIKKEILNNIKFNGDFETLIVDILEKNNKYYISCENKVVKNDSNYLLSSWYIESLKHFNNNISSNLLNQNMYLCLYLNRLKNNIGFVKKTILSDDEENIFINLSKELLNKIDDSLINTNNILKNINIIPSIVYYLYNLKYKKNDYYYENNNIMLRNNVVSEVSNSIVIRSINENNGKLEFYCSCDNISANLAGVKLYVDGKEYKYKSNLIYDDYKIFGNTFYRNFNFNFEIELSKVKNICFTDNFNNRYDLDFPYVASRLNNYNNDSYWNILDYYLKYSNKFIHINKNSFFINIKNELIYNFKIIKKEKIKLKVIFCLLIRFVYYLLKPFYINKSIWITFDKLYKGGDCGEYFFKYVSDNTDHKIYYIVNKNTKTYRKLSKDYKNILKFGSFKCMLLSLYASDIFETEFTAISFCGFKPFLIKYCKDLFNANIHCIQHGLTMQNIPHNQNKLNDNIKNYFIASKYEMENLLKDEYGYNKKNIILTGIPRFDGLKSKSENVILLSPTWRVDIASKGKSGKVRGYNREFKNTKYFKVYNSLINNKTLLEEMKKYNYKIKFLIHPTLISNIDDYDKNEYVDIVSTKNIDYEDVLTTSKVMITDYSGVQYDFAYMKKPIIYYHNELLPPSYDNGVMDYEKIGFGDIAKTEEELIKYLIKIVKHDCLIDKKYENRINSFFEFIDYNNCKRIYEYMKKDSR